MWGRCLLSLWRVHPSPPTPVPGVRPIALGQVMNQQRTWCSLGVRHLRLPAVKLDTYNVCHRVYGRTEVEAI